MQITCATTGRHKGKPIGQRRCVVSLRLPSLELYLDMPTRANRRGSAVHRLYSLRRWNAKHMAPRGVRICAPRLLDSHYGSHVCLKTPTTTAQSQEPQDARSPIPAPRRPLPTPAPRRTLFPTLPSANVAVSDTAVHKTPVGRKLPVRKRYSQHLSIRERSGFGQATRQNPSWRKGACLKLLQSRYPKPRM